MNTNDYKERVKRLRKAVSSVLNIECTQSQAYELMAKEENYPNWDALSGSIDKISTEKNTLTTKEQITQLFLLHEGIRHGQTFNSICSFLKEQTSPNLKKGWSIVNKNEYNKFSDVLGQTNFFSDDVLNILKISEVSGNLEKGLESSIKYLSMMQNVQS